MGGTGGGKEGETTTTITSYPSPSLPPSQNTKLGMRKNWDITGECAEII